jgi:cytidylate kinase
MHRAAFAAAVAGRLAQHLGKPAVDGGAFGRAVAMAAVRAGAELV